MSKQTKEEKRAEESRMIAEMEEAMREKEGQASNSATQDVPPSQTETSAATPTQTAPKRNKEKKGYHCPRCKTLLQGDGVCPTCGYKMYIPMDEKKRNKIKIILTAVLMAIFVVLFVILQFRK